MSRVLAFAIIVTCIRTNELELAEAVLRRFGCKIEVAVPCSAQREQLLRLFLSETPHALSRAHWEEVSAATTGWSGSDLEELCKAVALACVSEMCTGFLEPASPGSLQEGHQLPLHILPRAVDIEDFRACLRTMQSTSGFCDAMESEEKGHTVL